MEANSSGASSVPFSDVMLSKFVSGREPFTYLSSALVASVLSNDFPPTRSTAIDNAADNTGRPLAILSVNSTSGATASRTFASDTIV